MIRSRHRAWRATRPTLRRIALAATLGLGVAGAARAGEPRLLLSWNAPYGEPGARDRRDPACGDTLHADTLYLSVITGRSSKTFVGYMATLLFHARPGDTLGTYWDFPTGRGARSNLQLYLDPDSAGRARPALHAIGQGGVRYDRTESSGRLRVVYAVPATLASPVRDSVRYVLARVVFRHPREGERGCDQPVCFEWSEVALGYGTEAGEDRGYRGEQRFVSWATHGEDVCGTFRRAPPDARRWLTPKRRP